MKYTIFLIPILISFVGAMMFKHPPKKINLIIGFRTKESMKDEKAWIFANQYSDIYFYSRKQIKKWKR